MRLGGVAAEALEADGQRGCSGNFERVAGQEGQHGESQNRLSRGVGEEGKPKGAAGQKDEVAGPCAECGGSESASGAAPQERNQGRGQWVGKQVAAGGPKEMGQ